MSRFPLSKLGIFGFLLANIPTVVQSHAIEVRYCTASSGDIRIFVEHWHGDNPSTPIGRIRFTDTVAGISTPNIWRPRTGVINNVIPALLYSNGGCQESSTTLVSTCPRTKSAQTSQRQYDWVYFDLQVQCEVQYEWELLEGETAVLEDGCIIGNRDPPLYPATVSAFVQCPTPPPSPSPTTVPPTETPTETNTCTRVKIPQLGWQSCKRLGGTCKPDCDPMLNNCFGGGQGDSLCTSSDPNGKCFCVIPFSAPTPFPTQCPPAPAPTPRPTRMIFPSSFEVQDELQLGRLPFGGYIGRTDVTEYLKKDLIQKELEDILDFGDDYETRQDCENGVSCIGDESCDSLRVAEDFLAGDGSYLTTIPTYIATTSEPYNEMVQYYGGSPDPSSSSNFMQRWVQKAYQKKQFYPRTNRGSALFQDAFNPPNLAGPYEGVCIGFQEVLKRGLSNGATLVESYQLMQKSIDFAESGCSAQNFTEFGGPEPCPYAIEAWDAAAAIYVGSLEGTDGARDMAFPSYGKTLYTLADLRCRNFGTCGPDNGATYSVVNRRKDVTAAINTRILSLFQAGSHAAWYGDYALMKGYLRLISNKSAVPLIQEAFRHYYRLSDLEFGPGTFYLYDRELARGGAAMLPLLPKLWACSKKGEKKALDQSKIEEKNGPIDFLALQLAFECNYRCLGVTCAEVGTLYLGDEVPKPGFVTCDDNSNGSANVCSKQKGVRKSACKLYVGSPGVRDRNKLRFEF